MKATFDTKFTLQYATHCSDVFDLVYFYFSDGSGYTHAVNCLRQRCGKVLIEMHYRVSFCPESIAIE